MERKDILEGGFNPVLALRVEHFVESIKTRQHAGGVDADPSNCL
jgi:hypothetical protein